MSFCVSFNLSDISPGSGGAAPHLYDYEEGQGYGLRRAAGEVSGGHGLAQGDNVSIIVHFISCPSLPFKCNIEKQENKCAWFSCSLHTFGHVCD